MVHKVTVHGAVLRGILLAALFSFFGAAAQAQQSTVTYSENFQSYGKNKKPAGWIDNKVGSLNSRPRGYFKTRIDPTQDRRGTNIVYGSTKSSGHHDDDDDDDDDDWDDDWDWDGRSVSTEHDNNEPKRNGYFAIYQPKTFSASGRFEVTGRMIRVGSKSRIGLTVLSGYPDKDRYYLINEERAHGASDPTLRLSSYGAGTPTGKINSNVELQENKWYRFRIAVDSVSGATTIKARFWRDGTNEPSTWSIDAKDSSWKRLTSGRFGMWSGGTEYDDDDDDWDDNRSIATEHGGGGDHDDDDDDNPPNKGSYIDDLNARSPVDNGPPTIQFYESGVRLDPALRADFNRNAAIEIRVADELSTVSYTATLDNATYRSLDPIASEGTHTLKVRATDASGNVAEATLNLFLDKTGPVITLLENGQPLVDNAKFTRPARVEIRVTDARSTSSHTTKLDGAPYTSLTPITAEGAHVLLVEATDALNNKTTKQVRIVIDQTAPVIAFYESGTLLDATNAKFKVAPKIEIRALDGQTQVPVTATLNGMPYTPLTPITVDGTHTIVANATDEAGNAATQTLTLLVDKVAPVVVFRESGVVLDPTRTAAFARDAAIDVSVTDATSQVTKTIKLGNADYVPLTPITAEGTYALTVRATDATGNVTDATLSILIDRTKPTVAFQAGTTPLDPSVQHFFRDTVAIKITGSDAGAAPNVTATLNGNPYASETPIAAEGAHVIAVRVTDIAGNFVDAELRIVVDKTKPVITLSESGEPLASGATKLVARNAQVVYTVTDNQPGVTYTAKLDASDYASNAEISSEGTHALVVRAVDAAGNEAEATATLLIDKTGPTIAFFENNIELDQSVAKHKFKVNPSIDVRVNDAHSTPSTTATLNGAPYPSLTPIAEGNHVLSVHATDALNNASDATLNLLVDKTAPVVVLKEGTNVLPATGGIYNRNLAITAEVTDLSETTTTATLDNAPFSLTTPVAEEGTHTLSVTVTDELAWPTTVASTFTIDKTAPVIVVREGTTALLENASFARDIRLTATSDDITHVDYTATLDGQPYQLDTMITQDGTHTIVVNAVDAAGNHAEAATIRFHIERENPEIALKESGQPFPDDKSFARDIVATIDVTAATAWTSVVKIDNALYTLGAPYGVEGAHRIEVTVTTAAGNSSSVAADFEIDKTNPTIRILGNGEPMANDRRFSADFTPVLEASDNLTQPPVVVITLDGQTLAPDTPISEEKEHTISATATDRAGNSATAGPFTFVLDKSDPVVTVKVDGEPIENGDKFKTPITPLIEADDLTETTITATLDGQLYERGTPITDDGTHVLSVKATDQLGHETPLEPISFVIDKTAPIVTVRESDAPFESGSKYKRSVTPTVHVVDISDTIVTATLDGNLYTPGQEISSEGRHELNVLVTDELGWPTPVPTIVFTIDKSAPEVEVREGNDLLVNGTIFNRDVRPRIVVTDTTTPSIDATLDGQLFINETLVTTEGAHTLTGTVTDELGLFTPIPPISFIIDKTLPVVSITEAGIQFVDGAIVNHDAVPQASITDHTAVTITATLEGSLYTIGTPITTEGPHTLVWSAKDAAGWTTPDATIRFVIDKTAPVVTITDGGTTLAPGAELGRSVRPVINVTDSSATDVDATLDGQLFTSGAEVASEGTHMLAVTVTDAAGWETEVTLTFTIDKTAPVVRVLEGGNDFVSGTKFNRDVLPQIVVTDSGNTVIDAKLGPVTYPLDTSITTEGTHTLSITVTDRAGNAFVVPPISFLIDKTAPIVTINEGGRLLAPGSAFDRNVTPEIFIDDLTQPSVTATLNDEPFTFGTELTEEKRYALSVTVTDELGWPTTVPTIGFAIDKTAPVVELVDQEGNPITTGAVFNREVIVRANIEDTTDTTTTATLNDVAYTMGTAIESEGEYTIKVRVTDAVGLFVDVPPVTFRIDKTKPVLSFLTPASQQQLASAQVLVTGNADDAVIVVVNGVDAEVDLPTKRFTVPALELLEGPNTIVAVGTDAAGNISDPVSVDVVVDSRAPEVTIETPAANACLTTRDVTLSGTISDPNVTSVRLTIIPGTAPAVEATLSADRRSWTAALQFPAEGKFIIAVSARDGGDHESTSTVQVRIDQTKPRIEVMESGAIFNAPFVNRDLAPFVRVVDADPNVSLTVTLDGQPYTSGTPITSEKNFQPYELKATAVDCAGNHADEVVLQFVLDKTPPQFLTLSPADGASIGATQTIGGTVSPDTAFVRVEQSGAQVVAVNGVFAFPSHALTEGPNHLVLVAIDRAGNSTRIDYSFTLDTSTPTIEISENGSPIVSGTKYGRAVTVDVRSNEADATITATHNGQPFPSGTTISTNGAHTIRASASDSFGHTSATKEVTFTIDADSPIVTITEPADGASVSTSTIHVRGTVSGDPVSATINQSPLPLVNGTFDAEVALEAGPNQIVVTALDAAGNTGVATIDIFRGGDALGIILTNPVAGPPTNRSKIVVAGQVLSPAGVTSVTINGVAVPIDAAGAFRKNDFTLNEGPNTITAIVQKSGRQGSASVIVNADFTPPVVDVFESGAPLEDDARFTTRAEITVSATDAGQPVAASFLLDAASSTQPVVVTAAGGHTLVVVARDAAGNETRVERTFFIGSTAGAGGCALTGFDPAHNSLVSASTVTLVGRTGGAAGVKVNGIAAVVSNGSFSATVNLPNEGENEIHITCTDANGSATGTPATITLIRATGAPSVAITTPDDHSVTANETITVSGTVQGEVSLLTVNGTAVNVVDNAFTANNVRLIAGVNVIVARARNAAGRTASDSVHVTWLKDQQRSITITSPASALTVRTETIDISGVWSHLDPASITVANAPAQTTSTSDTTGTFFAAAVPLSIGQQTITVRGLDRLGRETTATIAITRADGKPSITIAAPADNAYFNATTGATFTVNGTFDAVSGSTVEINGQAATIDGNTFTANVTFSTLPNGLTPVIARVTEPAGNHAVDTIRVSKLGAAPQVVQTFPDADAVDVDSAALPLVLFSAPMDRTSVRNAFRLENAAGTAVSGDITLDKDVLTFAPAVLLASAERYTIRIAASAADLAGNTMAAEFTRSFTVAASAPATSPSLDAHASRACDFLDLAGTALPNSRVRIDLGTLSFNTTATSIGAFTFRLPLSGRSGFQVARVRIIGSDGSLSPAAEAHFEVDCTGPQVANATFDRNANVITVTFSKAIDIATITTGSNGSARMQLTDGTLVGGTVVALALPSSISITPSQDLTAQTFTLTLTTAIRDTTGVALIAPFARAFATGELQLGDGNGYISGEIFDADTGRPLAGASVSIELPTGALSTVTDNRGRYVRELPEGAHTIRAAADQYTTVWRQIVVRAGAGVIPTDIRLTRRGATKSGDGSAVVLTHAQPLALDAELRIPAGVVANGGHITLTTLGAQSLAGLLPLGWSPLASAEIVSNAPALSGGELTFAVPQTQLENASQTLTAVRYFDDRDEWRAVLGVVPMTNGKASFPIASAGAYALVYRDQGPRLQSPPVPASGGLLSGVTDPCTGAETPCPALAAKEALHLDPPVVLPSGRTVATLRIEGANASLFPSGTAVQAYVDEELRLADGTRDVVAPFATDLLLYRTLDGGTGEARFHLAPSARAAEVVLEVGYDHIRILPYPERLDRGTLIGPEGGRVPADDRVTVDVPAGAITEAVHASATSITDLSSFGTIAGYRIVGGLALTLQWAGAPADEEVTPVSLTKPARATFTVDAPSLPSQLILVEVLDGTAYGRMFRLASQMVALEGTGRYSTKTIDRAVLPVDGIVREGRYLLLAPDAPIAFTTGTVHLGVAGPATANARVLTPALGVADLTRITGIFNVPVPASTSFSLVPRTPATGDGIPYERASGVAADAVVNVGQLSLVAQPPSVELTLFAHNANGSLAEVSADNATEVALSTSIKASFTPGVDPQSVTAQSLTVVSDDGTIVAGRAVAQGNTAILWTLDPGTRLRADATYTAIVSPLVRGPNGTPLGTTRSATFATVRTLDDPNVDPSKIRITLPDENGRAQIIGAPGALREHWNAVAVRRGRDFTTRPQDTADAQNSFVIELGTGNDPNDRISISDIIYLQIINEAGAVAAIVQLGPFTTADGRGFVARPDAETRFTTVDNITVAVPEGAFETATVVHIEPAAKSVFEDVPGFNEELGFFAGFKIDFEGVASKRLDITFPTPASLPADKTPFLGYHGISSQGPRIMLIDLLRRDGANLTTYHPPDDPNARGLRVQDMGTNAIVNPNTVRDMLMGIDRAAIIVGFTFQTAVNFITFFPPPQPMEFFIPPVKSIYHASFVPERGRRIIPVPADIPFTILGIDPGSRLTMINAPQNPVAPGEPTSAIEITLPSTNDYGPYPVFSAPGRTHMLEITSETFLDESIRGIVAKYDDPTKILTLSNSSKPLPADTRVSVLNLTTGAVQFEDSFSGALNVNAQLGDKLVVLVGEADIAPVPSLTVVFSEPIKNSTIVALRDQFKLFVSRATPPFDFKPMPGFADITLESGGRRVLINLPGPLQRGKRYRLTLAGIVDRDTAPLALGQKKDGPVPGPLHLDFTVRSPKGSIGEFEIPSGSVRDLAKSGNVLLVSALEGGILAYDISNPATLLEPTVAPMAKIKPPPGADSATWALATDNHGRVFATALSTMYGVVRSYRIEDFYCADGGCPVEPEQKGNAIVSWRTGINVGMPVASMIVGGWPEATPRKMQIVTKDAEPVVGTFATLVGTGEDVGNEFLRGTIDVSSSSPSEYQYDKQRVTVENTTQGYRWSADIDTGGSTTLTVFGRATDSFRIVRNLTTLGVVSLFGHGVGAYDLNAIDANYRNISNASWERLEDTLALDSGDGGSCGLNPPCDNGTMTMAGKSCPINDLVFSPEATVLDLASSFGVLALQQNRGVVQLKMNTAPTLSGEAISCDRAGSLILAEKVPVINVGIFWAGHPRLNQLRRMFRVWTERDPSPRYTSIAPYRKKDGAQYALVAGYEYGLLVVKADATLSAKSLVDVIWIPGGAMSVRVMQKENLAVVVDGKGRVLLVNLLNIDESSKVPSNPPACTGLDCEWDLFPTIKTALTPPPPPPGTTITTPAPTGDGVGFDDPRIIWKSEVGAVNGTLAPIIDPDTGFVFTGDVLAKRMNIMSAIDPTIRIIGQTGKGDTGGVQVLDRIVPLGVQPPPNLTVGANGSLAAFRVEVILPGSIAESLGGPARIAVESERVIGARTGQSPAPLPRARLTQDSPRPAPNFELRHDGPEDVSSAEAKKLRYQSGWNRMITPWIIAIADPRASEKYLPIGDRVAEGCVACERPPALQGVGEPLAFELYSAGRIIAARPDPSAYTGNWAWIAQAGRMQTRINSVPADTIRPKSVQVAAFAPPVAVGTLQETHYLHSGELETSSVDVVAGGRSSMNVAVDRTYRSRTLGYTPLGFNWDSSMFRRLRELPIGDVEYRDGAELWTFKRNGNTGAYTSPRGLFLNLTRTQTGWTLTDQMWRAVAFDELGRIVSEYDEFYTPADPSKGNIIRYSYDDQGRLKTIVDPVGRPTTLKYYNDGSNFSGLLEEVSDWHGDPRTAKYEYDFEYHLETVLLPEAKAAPGVPSEFNLVGENRPKVDYTYENGAPIEYKDALELRTNLASIAPGGTTRVSFTFDLSASAPKRDRTLTEKWGTGEEATFDYSNVATPKVTDAMTQVWNYTLTGAGQYDQRVHLASIVAANVSTIPDSALPDVAPTTTPASNVSLTTTFSSYNDEGQLVTATYPNGLSVTNEYVGAFGNAPGTVLKGVKQAGPFLNGGEETTIGFDDQQEAVNNVAKVSRKKGSGDAVERDAETPSRARLETVSTDVVDGSSTIVTRIIHNKAGQLTDTIQEDGNKNAKMKAWTVYHSGGSNAERVDRSRPFMQYKGLDNAPLEKYRFEYSERENGGEFVEMHDDVRKTVTATLTDAYGRPTSVISKDKDENLLSDEQFGYDAAGHLRFHSRLQTPLGFVETRTTYDAVGRETETTTAHNQVNGNPVSLTSTTQWQLGMFKVTRFDPSVGASTSQARETTTLDAMGRALLVERADTNGNRIRTVLGYDKAGNVAYRSDGTRIASLHLHDALGREIDSVASDGTRRVTTWNGWGQPVEEFLYTGADLISSAKSIYTEEGRLRARNEQIDASSGAARQTHMAWTSGGETTTARVGQVDGVGAEELDDAEQYRTIQTELDLAGRVKTTVAGLALGNSGLITDPLKTFARTTNHYEGSVVKSITTEEPRQVVSYVTNFDHDGLGRTTSVIEGEGKHVTDTSYDQAGNPVSVKRLSVNQETAKYDSRGLLIERTLSDGKVLQYQYDELGNLRQYRDEATEATRYVADSLGRIHKTEYPDDTFEEVVFEDATGMVKAQRSRDGQWVSFTYDAGGRVLSVVDGPDPEASSATTLLKYEYDGAGRLVRIRNKDAGVEYAEYDLLGRPAVTRSYVYDAQTGVDDSPTVKEVHSQRHVWNVHDERDSWRMPAAGEVAPLPDADDPASPWLQTITEVRDGGSNLTEQNNNATSALMVKAQSRSVSRLHQRTQRTASAQEIVTTFGYADGLTPVVPMPGAPTTPGGSVPAPPKSGMPLWHQTQVGGETLAGLSIARDGVKRLDEARDLAMDRRTDWEYDARGRLTNAWLALPSLEFPVTDAWIDADFRNQRTSPATLTESQHELLGESYSLALEPPTWTATKTSTTHAVDQRQLYLDGEVKKSLDYVHSKGRRDSDGTWSYSYDRFGRVSSATSMAAGRKIEFTWNPNDRLVGRSAYRDSSGTWVLEDRSDVLVADGLPAEITLVWDPIVDRLVAIFKKGLSTSGPAEAGLLRQYLHGDQGYDDPVQVRIADAVGATPKTYYPLSDATGTGSLSAIVGDDGSLVERVLYADAYGDAPRYLQGPVVDKIMLEAKKTAEGALERVTVRMHLSERITAATLTAGVNLASVKADASVAQVAFTEPELEDDYTVMWEILPTEWEMLVTASGAQSLEIVTTDALRAKGWGQTPVAPVPDWALRVFSGIETTSARPVIKREPLTLITEFIDSIPPTETRTYDDLYEIKSLYLAASSTSKAKLLFDFHMLPFREPATSLIYSRARWYDSATGTFLSADPMGYVDSSNLYAFCAGDPMNCSDPTGMFAWDPAAWGHWIEGKAQWVKRKIGAASMSLAADTGNRALDDAINAYVGSIEAQMGMVVDFVSGVPVGLLTIGEATGTAIDEYGCHDLYSCGMTTAAIGGDVASTILYAIGIAGAIESRLSALKPKPAVPTPTEMPAPRSGGPERIRKIREALSDGSGKRLRPDEMAGVKRAIRQIERAGYELEGSVKYRGNQGIDLHFRGVGENSGRIALAEAKATGSLSSLKVDTLGIRQGSYEFFRTRLARAIVEGDPAMKAAYRQMYGMLRSGKADLFGYFAGSGRLMQFNPSVFVRNINFQTTRGGVTPR